MSSAGGTTGSAPFSEHSKWKHFILIDTFQENLAGKCYCMAGKLVVQKFQPIPDKAFIVDRTSASWLTRRHKSQQVFMELVLGDGGEGRRRPGVAESQKAEPLPQSGQYYGSSNTTHSG